jgi:hypothetical protein
VSDSYDAEFGTGANAEDVREAIEEIVARMSEKLGTKLENIVSVVQGEGGRIVPLPLRERDCRVIRFALNRALETI